MRLRDAAADGKVPCMSTAQKHLLSVLEDLRSVPSRVLEAGCGDGSLLVQLKARGYEVYGFDLENFGLQDAAFFDRCHARLPGLRDDPSRLRLIDEQAPWPFEEMQAVISNQVIEHVRDHEHFFANHRRVLAARGIGLHVFPAREVLFDFHVNLPLAHRIANEGVLRRYIAGAGRLGFGKAARPESAGGGAAGDLARYLKTLTNYRSLRELRALALRQGLVADFSKTVGFYERRFGLRPLPSLGGVWPWKYLANVTMILRREEDL
jgi:SAM-dependent methyltransferase